MLETVGDMWEEPCDMLCVLTNGDRRSDGCAVMGARTALQAKCHYPDIPELLGELLRLRGNHVHDLGVRDGRRVLSFPTKHHWRDAFADLELIRRSCRELVDAIGDQGMTRILIPRPGCGAGRLGWSVVRPVLEEVLVDDKFVVISSP